MRNVNIKFLLQILQVMASYQIWEEACNFCQNCRNP